jgi:hypothetical protein
VGRATPGANNVADHVAVFAEACGQLPELPAGVGRLVRADSAGASHAFLESVRDAGWAFSVAAVVDDDGGHARPSAGLAPLSSPWAGPGNESNFNAAWLTLAWWSKA